MTKNACHEIRKENAASGEVRDGLIDIDTQMAQIVVEVSINTGNSVAPAFHVLHKFQGSVNR